VRPEEAAVGTVEDGAADEEMALGREDSLDTLVEEVFVVVLEVDGFFDAVMVVGFFEALEALEVEG